MNSDVDRKISIDLLFWQDDKKGQSIDFFVSQQTALNVSVSTLQKTEDYITTEAFQIPVCPNLECNFDKVWYDSKKPPGENHYDFCCIEVPEYAVKVNGFKYMGEFGTYTFDLQMNGILRLRDDPFYPGGDGRCYSKIKPDIHGELMRPVSFSGSVMIENQEGTMAMCYTSDMNNRNMIQSVERPMKARLGPCICKDQEEHDDACNQELGFERICLMGLNGPGCMAKLGGNGPQTWPEFEPQHMPQKSSDSGGMMKTESKFKKASKHFRGKPYQQQQQDNK